MNYDIRRTLVFEKKLKSLAKKYASIKNDYAALLEHLQIHPTQGTPLGQSCYKLSMAIASKNKGKSGGARVITLVKVEAKRITLLDIYDKSDKETITEKELTEILKALPD